MIRQRRGPWGILSERTAYENPWISVTEYDVIQPDGTPGVYGVMSPRNFAIGVLPIFEDGTTLLVGQHRFTLDSHSWELPEGGGPKTDDPLVSAQRELAEETGYRADHWSLFLEMDLSNSVTDEQAFAFLAWGLSPGETALEASEADLKSRRVSFDEALHLAMTGEIRDAFTVAMLAKADYMRRRESLPAPVLRALT
ncbi:NUDIX domain-containing protein [Marinicauda pacifica]|uniref:NUDIX domain-containing protein n=1 Tax=Marinicauda pacifica TaxID=1133559 RepID=UPI0035C7A3F2